MTPPQVHPKRPPAGPPFERSATIATGSLSANTVWHRGNVEREPRWRRLGQRGGTVWFTGLSASGKSTFSSALEAVLVEKAIHCYRLDGDNVRHGLNGDLGFSAKDRIENIRRLAEVAILLADSGCIAVVAAISPYLADRKACRRRHGVMGIPFLEVFVDTPLELCEQRDPKGLYKKARQGIISDFTGVSAPYEAPDAPDLRLDGSVVSSDEAVRQLVALLPGHGVLRQFEETRERAG